MSESKNTEPVLGDVATVIVDGNSFTGTVYHVRENGWPCVECPDGHIASGPAVQNA